MSSSKRWIVSMGLLLATASGCIVRGPAPLLVAMAGSAIATAAIISAVSPPPPRVVVVPAPRPGYYWQPGYWMLRNGTWIWVEGGWVIAQPGYAWSPTHWERSPDGTWQLIPGRWVPLP